MAFVMSDSVSMYVHRKTMGDFFAGMTFGDQLEMGIAIVGGGMDNETLNASHFSIIYYQSFAISGTLDHILA